MAHTPNTSDLKCILQIDKEGRISLTLYTEYFLRTRYLNLYTCDTAQIGYPHSNLQVPHHKTVMQMLCHYRVQCLPLQMRD